MNTDELASGDVAAADAIFHYIKELQHNVRISKHEARNLREALHREELRHADTRADLLAFKDACVRAPAGSLVFAHKKEQLQEVGEAAFESELGVLIQPQAMSQCVAAIVKAILEELERTGGLYEIPIQRAGSQVQEASDLDG